MTSFKDIAARSPQLDTAVMRRSLTRPETAARVIIDTDTANEIDDQYALAWALLSPGFALRAPLSRQRGIVDLGIGHGSVHLSGVGGPGAAWPAGAREAKSGQIPIRDARLKTRFDFSGGLFCRHGGALPYDLGQNSYCIDTVPVRQEQL